MNERKVYLIPLYIVLLSVYPVVSLLASNINEVDPWVAVRSIMAFLLFSWIIYYMHLVYLGERDRAGALTALVQVLFFSYGHIYNYIIYEYAIEKYGVAESLFRNIHLLMLTGVLVVYLIVRKITKDRSFKTDFLTVISLVMFIVPIDQLNQNYFANRSDIIPTPSGNLHEIEGVGLPDIYYIVLDGYTRADIVEIYGYDNSSFIDSLRSMGFYVADCGLSNYRKTLLSLSSALNMDYLWNVIEDKGSGDIYLYDLNNAIRNSRVRIELESLGYQTVAFSTGFPWSELDEEADIYLALDENFLTAPYLYPFEYMFIETTMVKAMIDIGPLGFLKNSFIKFVDHYDRVNYVLDTLPDLVSLPGPKFVFAHIVTPHPPYIFLPDGSITSEDDNLMNGYINNIRFINPEIKSVVAQIIKDSENPPIIVIQSDHGMSYISDLLGVYFNFSAFYFPGQDNEVLYPTVSAVNTFRFIFNLYFGADYSILEDIAINTDQGDPTRNMELDLGELQAQCISELAP